MLPASIRACRDSHRDRDFISVVRAASSFLRYREGQRQIPVAFHRIMRALLGLSISVKGVPAPGRPLMIVANHTSWLDIIVISSFLPVVFVAKHELRPGHSSAGSPNFNDRYSSSAVKGNKYTKPSIALRMP